MAEGWFPEAIVDPGNDAGGYEGGNPKGLLHTTEGKNYAGARSAYVTNNSWPHATCTYEHGFFEIWQHNSIFVAARALRNADGGWSPNRSRVVQLEIVGTADRNNAGSWGNQYVENFPTPYLDGIARWMAFINAELGAPNRCTVTFKTYPESYGTNNGVRLSQSGFDNYSGWLGHMHAAENTHGDPGLIAIDYLISQAEPAPPIPPPTPIPDEEDDDMKDLMLVAGGKSPCWVHGDRAILLLNASTRDNLVNDGDIKKVEVSASDYDRIVAALGAPELVDNVEEPNP